MPRKATPGSILDDLMSSQPAALVPAVDDTALLRQQLRYDYSLIPTEQRGAVQAAAVDIVRFGRQAQESLIAVGQRLADVKRMLEHGQFEDWCTAEFQMTPRTVQNMMNVAKAFGDKSEKFSLLSDSTLYMLAAPSTPEAARVEVLERVQTTGQKPSVSEVRETISRHKPQPVKVTRMPQRDDAAEDTWQPAQQAPAIVRPSAPAADPYDHAHGDAIRHDLAVLDSVRVAAADVAFGMAQPRHTALAALLQQVLDAIPELTRLSGRGGDCVVLTGALTNVHAALVAAAVAPTAPATELPADLVAHGWELRQARQGGMWFAAITPPDEEREITTVKRSKITDVIGDCRFMEKSLKIGAPA